jgi:hypothetical protein
VNAQAVPQQTRPVFNYVNQISNEKQELVDENFVSSNPLMNWSLD